MIAMNDEQFNERKTSQYLESAFRGQWAHAVVTGSGFLAQRTGPFKLNPTAHEQHTASPAILLESDHCLT